MSITHAFVSAVADGADADKVRPSDWNAAHACDGLAIAKNPANSEWFGITITDTSGSSFGGAQLGILNASDSSYSLGGFWLSQAAPSWTNYAFLDAGSGYVAVNGASGMWLRVGNWSYVKIDGSGNILLGEPYYGHYTKIATGTGNLSFVGNAGFYPRTLNQTAEPAAGTGATQLDTGELCIWTDSDDSKCYLCFNHGGTVKTVELA